MREPDHDHLAVGWQTDRFRKTPHSRGNRVARQIWSIAYIALFRPSPRVLHGWRRFLLRCFGARVGKDVKLFPSVRVWAPWNLELGDRCSLGDGVNCYSVDKLTIGACATISQNATLCTATHDATQLHLPLITEAITIGDHAWLCAETFVMPGVKIGAGAVVGVRSTVFGDIPPWQIAYGAPCKIVRPRKLADRPRVHGETEEDKRCEQA